MNKLFAYPGGKWPIRHLIISAFLIHTTFVDVFGGSAAIIITKEKSGGEVFNDKNEELVNFFRVVKHRPAELAERFQDVHVECLDFKECIKNYDSPETLFYCDPPYPDTRGGNTNYNLLSEQDWQDLCGILSNIQGKFLLSSNDHKMVRKLFKGFNIRKIDVRVTLPRSKNAGNRKELLISNYKLPPLSNKRREEVII
jgi:site-specific DNA-adenine methylase